MSDSLAAGTWGEPVSERKVNPHGSVTYLSHCVIDPAY